MALSLQTQSRKSEETQPLAPRNGATGPQRKNDSEDPNTRNEREANAWFHCDCTIEKIDVEVILFVLCTVSTMITHYHCPRYIISSFIRINRFQSTPGSHSFGRILHSR